MRLRGVLTTGAVAIGVAAMAQMGCSASASSSSATDGGSEDDVGIRRIGPGADAGGSEPPEASSAYTGPALMTCTQTSVGGAMLFGDGGAVASGDGGAAGTTGKTCASGADCNGNICELTDPTPICVVPQVDPTTGANCDPGTDGNLHFCDGPDMDTSPGICLPLDNPPVSGQGLCLQACTYATDGTAAQGCTGNDACNASGLFLQTMTGGVLGLGYCGGGCTKDADCQGPNTHCLTELGLCLAGAAPVTSPACNCALDVNGSGFCAQACVVGSPTPCPTGTVCDALEPGMFTDETDASIPGFSVQNAGLTGYCLPTCSGSEACPAGSKCVDETAAGYDCQP